MKKSYIFVYNPSLGTRDELREFIGNCDLILVWRFELTGSFFLVSRASSDELSEAIHEYFGKGKSKFFISEISDNSQGWLEQRSWSVINDKKLPPKKRANKQE